MNELVNNETFVLTGYLSLDELSAQNFPKLTQYEHVKNIDLQQLKNIDSAGLAYIAQIKSRYPDLYLIGISDKLKVLGKLYGLSFLLESQGV